MDNKIDTFNQYGYQYYKTFPYWLIELRNKEEEKMWIRKKLVNISYINKGKENRVITAWTKNPVLVITKTEDIEYIVNIKVIK